METNTYKCKLKRKYTKCHLWCHLLSDKHSLKIIWDHFSFFLSYFSHEYKVMPRSVWIIWIYDWSVTQLFRSVTIRSVCSPLERCTHNLNRTNLHFSCVHWSDLFVKLSPDSAPVMLDGHYVKHTELCRITRPESTINLQQWNTCRLIIVSTRSADFITTLSCSLSVNHSLLHQNFPKYFLIKLSS